MLEYVNMESLTAREADIRTSFRAGEPFRHVEIQDLVRPTKLQEVRDAFPQEDWPFWQMYPSEHASRSKVCESTSVLPAPITRLLMELNSGPFLYWLESVTGIKNLLPDPHLKGGGIHMTLPGGALTPHIDHHLVPSHPRFRQLNIILYLSEDWKPENQGYYELWDKKARKVHKEIPPEFGRCLLFKTDDSSMHGFSKPVKNANRRSLALFYYTAIDSGRKYGGNAATFWQPKIMEPEDSIEGIRLKVQQLFWNLSRFFGWVSWKLGRIASRLIKTPEP